MLQDLHYQGLAHRLSPRSSNSHKGSYGRILLVGGNAQLGGAILLAAQAAVWAGAGLTTVATHPHNHTALHARLPEAMVVDWTHTDQLKRLCRQAQVILLGPGLGLDHQALHLLQTILTWVRPPQRLILDGDALTLLAQTACPLPSGVSVIVTPHQMEWQRLSGLSIADQDEAANRQAQQALGVSLVLKKAGTELYFPDGQGYRLTVGTPAMATGGMGDTLAGIITAFLAQFPEQETLALQSAVFLHSYIAQDLAQTRWVVLPHQISEALPQVMKDFIG